MQIKFDVFWTKNLGTLYKDNSVDTYGKEAKVDLDLKEVHNIHINFKVNDKSFTDIAHIVDVEVGLIRIPFKTDVIKLGTHELELVATMKNGDVLPSQTYKYTVDKSLENPNAIETDTNYPILIELLQEVGEKISDTEEAINRLDNSIDEMENTINNSLKENTNIINKHIDNMDNNFNTYIENIDNDLFNKFNNYSINTDKKVNSKISELEGFIEDKEVIISNTIKEANNNINEAILKIPPKSELIGEKGATGPKGDKGDKGDIGPVGPQGLQGDKGERGIQGEKGDTPSIAHLEKQVSDKTKELDTKFNTLTAKQQQDAEVVTARDGEVSLHARLERDLVKGKIHFVDVEGSNISIESQEGYLENIEILGNTIQDSSNLADIRSVGTKVEGQELYEIPVLTANGLDNSDSNYQEDKLTILSPVQLEKVGGVADRIICKDGVWGVEKNIATRFNYNEQWIKVDISSSTYSIYYKNEPDVKTLSHVVSNIIPTYKYGALYSDCNEFAIGTHNNSSTIRVCIEKSKLLSDDKQGFMNWLKSNGGLIVKYATTQPTFIPLPHDQQIKLRTFADRTHISFDTEIEPTLKAQVPKSLGATVNTHTTQIDNLNKELDRVIKGLKQILAGDMMSLAYLLYPEDFDKDSEVKTLEEL